MFSRAWVIDLHGVLIGLLLDDVKGAVDHLLGHALLAVQHDAVGQLGHQDGVIQRIGQNLPLGYISSSGHFASLLLIKLEIIGTRNIDAVQSV